MLDPSVHIRPVVKGSPVKDRRGPATVTGREVVASKPLGTPQRSWEGASTWARKPGDLSPASQDDPRGKGWLQMNGSTGRLGGALFAIAATLLLASAGEAVAQTVPSDLRVVAPDGRELADVRQYVGKTVVPTSPDADCFGPGNRGSGNKVTQVGPDALSVVVEASAGEGPAPAAAPHRRLPRRRLRARRLRDRGTRASSGGFWYLKINHKNPNLGGVAGHRRARDRDALVPDARPSRREPSWC